MKKTRGQNHAATRQAICHRLLAWTAMGLAFVWLAACLPILAAHAAEAPVSQAGPDGGLTIEVVEEISIDDEIIIADGEVPLAMFSDTRADAGPRHAAMMGIVLASAAGYAAYCGHREKSLFALRREAARAQKEAMDSRHAHRDDPVGRLR